jgi:hypothetical protein
MPLFMKRVVLAANGTASVMAGSSYEFVGFPALLEAGIQADATGVLAYFASGTDVLLEPDSPVQIGTINVSPKYPDDFYLRDAVAPGDRLVLNLRDTSGAQRIVMCAVKLTPA